MGVQEVIVSFTADHASLVLLLVGATLVGTAAWWRRHAARSREAPHMRAPQSHGRRAPAAMVRPGHSLETGADRPTIGARKRHITGVSQKTAATNKQGSKMVAARGDSPILGH
jgi:hypothetical protein